MQCVYRSWGKLLHTVWKRSVKSFVAPHEAACNPMDRFQWCHSVAKLHCGQCRHQALKSSQLFWHRTPAGVIMESLKTNHLIRWSRIRDVTFFIRHVFFSLSKPGAYITHNATYWITFFFFIYLSFLFYFYYFWQWSTWWLVSVKGAI